MEPGVQPPYGNLMSYKTHVRPHAEGRYGMLQAKPGLQKSAEELLRILFMHGGGTTWDMAGTRLKNVRAIRDLEKAYRRLIIGRVDRNTYSGGLLSSGLVAKVPGQKRYIRYRLTPHGILYCIDALEPDRKEMNSAASVYADMLPMVFGKWGMLKRVLGKDAFSLKILASGILLDSPSTASADNPGYELMAFIHAKYAKNFEAISEEGLAQQISYWFYTYLLHQGKHEKLEAVMRQDPDVREWYLEFFKQAMDHHAKGLRRMSECAIIGGKL